MTDQQIVATGAAVLLGMTGNLAFPAPPVELPAVQAVLDGLMAALAAQAHGGPATTAEKNNKREALSVLLRRLAHYVEACSNNNLAVLLSSGFSAASANRAQLPLMKPAIVSVDNGKSTQLLVKVGRIAQARCYELRAAAIVAGGAQGPWQAATLCTSSRSMAINGLTPGITYAVQARAIGGSTGSSDWSDSVAHMCM